MKEFLVVSRDGNLSWNEKADRPESFTTFAAAARRAKEVATSDPGPAFGIYQRVSEAWCDVAPAKVSVRK